MEKVAREKKRKPPRGQKGFEMGRGEGNGRARAERG